MPDNNSNDEFVDRLGNDERKSYEAYREQMGRIAELGDVPAKMLAENVSALAKKLYGQTIIGERLKEAVSSMGSAAAEGSKRLSSVITEAFNLSVHDFAESSVGILQEAIYNWASAPEYDDLDARASLVVDMLPEVVDTFASMMRAKFVAGDDTHDYVIEMQPYREAVEDLTRRSIKPVTEDLKDSDERIGRIEAALAKALDDYFHEVEREQRQQTNELEETPKQDQITLRKQYGAVANTTQALTHEALFSDGGELLEAGGGIKTHFVLAVADDNVKLSSKLDEFDKNILSAIASLKEAGGRYFTAAQICAAMGIKKSRAKQQQNVLERMERMSTIRADIDFSGESQRRGLDVKSDVVRGPLLNFYSRVIKTRNGKTITGLDIIDLPITYQHAKAIGQLVSYPQRYLSMGEGSATEKNQILRRIVCERVEQMRNRNGRISNVIRYEHSDKHPDIPGLFERAGVNLGSRSKRAEANKFVLSLLEDLKNDEAISSYSEVKSGQRVVGVEIQI